MAPASPEAPPFAVDAVAITVLERLWAAGHAAYLVGGAVRDALQGRPSQDWDVATDARPDRLLDLFPDGRYENRFGTVLVDGIEVTTFRRDHVYGDHRRPDQVTFTTSLTEDLARRDFTVNAIAWGRGAHAAAAELVDPTGGLTDLAAGRLRAVGDPAKRFGEDALRLLRAARIAGAAGLAIEPGTLAGMAERAADVRWVSGERAGMELRRMLLGTRPSDALRPLMDTGVLAALIPELAPQRGLAQGKIPGHDLWDHTLLTTDSAVVLAAGDVRLAMAALLHDVGKPSTAAEGHFHGHAAEGGRMAATILGRIRWPGREIAVITRLVAEHMFQYLPSWSDAAVRRFVRRAGADVVGDLLRLREADNLGSGVPADGDGVAELRARVERQLASGAPLQLADVAVDGDDLVAALGRPPGPWLGVLLERLLESVIADPSRNTAGQLIADAWAWGADAPEADAPPPLP